MPNPGLQKLQPWQELEISRVFLSAQNDSLCYKTTFSPLMKILSFAAALTKCSFGDFVLADILGFVPFKQHESVLDIEQELDGICKWIKASQFTSICSTLFKMSLCLKGGKIMLQVLFKKSRNVLICRAFVTIP